jgi:hypothetical protein
MEDSAMTTYSPPSREEIENLTNQNVHQPIMPALTILKRLSDWRREVNYAMSTQGMAAADGGRARLDKGMADQNGLRILRSFVRDVDGNFVDNDLEKNCPLLFGLLKILTEKHDIQHVALQKMMEQKPHCDPHARNAKPEDDAKECHVLITVGREHCFGVSTSHKIQTREDRFTEWTGGGRGKLLKKWHSMTE